MTAKRKVGRPRVHIPLETIRHLRGIGLSFRQISFLTGLGYGSVRRAWKQLGDFDQSESSGAA